MSDSAERGDDGAIVQHSVVRLGEPSAKYLVKDQSKNLGAGSPPSEWAVKPLGELSEFITSGSRGWASYYTEHGATFIRSQNILKGQLDFSDHQCVVPPVGSEGSRTRVELGDLLITITGNSVGNVAYVDHHLGEAYISQHVGLVRLKDSESAAYVCRFLSSGAPGNAQIVSSQSGQSKPGLNLTNLRDFLVAVPPKEEQRAIATALSDVDALIAGLERLIAKKRDIKQAAMQRLLTGQTRLPGFSGEWVPRRLGQLGVFLKGSGIKRDQALSGELPCVRYGELYTVHSEVVRTFHSRISPQVAATATRIHAGDLLFAGSGETKAEIGKCAAMALQTEAYAGGDIVILRLRSGDPSFFGYLLNTPAVACQKANLGQGDAVVHISASALSSIEVKVPSVDEQTAIATVLSDMDNDLATLESRLAKTRAIKQGMMQELLTGRTRLVAPGAPQHPQEPI